MTSMLTLTDFLLARIDEDAVRATLREWHAEGCDYLPAIGSDYTYPCDCGVPERMRAECKAKRQIVAAATRPGDPVGRAVMEFVLGRMATVYADHPDYRDEWRP